ncbi:glycine/betaine ABC transporter [Anaerobacillus arseniciselenatis]|uniref:Glycine/betaine ABC transporter n=1 Tax=Anaerobacillus arseniciselenatis TaxID=85682 RepID=A0A1S2LR12_9BACI|nr:BCCT family transporter [Anaerobacillus arseniciselenatis]OIJ14640.1 glycine/betaine ABC transporter [Anaerobacillus arseniciselenatis]
MNMNVKEKPGIVFYISSIIIALFVSWGIISPTSLQSTANHFLGLTIENFGWFYMIVTAFFIGFILFLAISPFGKLKLGKQDETPQYSYYTWIGMLFSAGIGVGFVFWGVAEPVLYYIDAPYGVTPETADAARIGLRYAVFHWAFHPWAIFSLVALALAYVQYRKDQPALISSAFYPLLGKKAHGNFGKGIDILAVIATSTGVATTFGLSAIQITGGLSHLTNIPNNVVTQLIVIFIVTILFIISAASGLDRGIRILSITNLTIAGILLVFMIVFGPTLFIAESAVTTLGGYISNLVPMSLTMTPFTDSVWLGAYTIFFWAWHISWAPFMGLFIARISRGRTIREFVFGVLIVPSALGLIWFTAFGGTALHLIKTQGSGIADVVMNNVELALFVTLSELPLGMFMSGIAVFLILIFFITSADSASYVLGAMTSKGSLTPSLGIKVIWGLLIAGTATVLLLSGGLTGLQTASIVAALPFAIIMVAMCFSIIIMFSKDLKEIKKKRTKAQLTTIKETIREEMYDDIKSDIYDEVKEELYEEIKEEVIEEVKEEVIDEVKEEVLDHFDSDQDDQQNK